MDPKELDDIFDNFDKLMDKINDEIEKSDISNHDLSDFQLKFKGGKCTLVCVKKPSGRIVCYCKDSNDIFV